MTNLTEQTKSDIIKTFDFLLGQQFEYNDYSDSYKHLNDASDRAKDEFERNFEEYNNSTWIDPDSAIYEQKKELVLDFVRTL